MTALYDRIQDMRAELQSRHLTPRERNETEAELARAIACQAELDHAFDAAMEAENHHVVATD